MNYINEKKVSPLVVAIIVFVLLLVIAGVLAYLNMKCVFGHAYTDGVCERCAYVCVHESVGTDGVCTECTLTVKVENLAPEESIEAVPGAVNTATGEALVSGQAYAMTNMAFTKASLMSTTAKAGITVTADVYPACATNKSVDWIVYFVDPESEWATGKVVTDYVTVTPTSDGSRQAVITCLASFGEQIKVGAVSRDNPNAIASISVDYLQTIESVQVRIGDIVLTPGDNYIHDFVIESGKVGPGGEVSVEYVGGETYTIGFEEPTYGVLFKGTGEDSFAYTYEVYNEGVATTVTETWYPDFSVAENDGEYEVITFDIDWLYSRFAPYGDYVNGRNDIVSWSTDDLYSQISSAKEAGTSVFLTINVPVVYTGSPENIFFKCCFGSLADVSVDSVSIEGDVTFGGE